MARRSRSTRRPVPSAATPRVSARQPMRGVQHSLPPPIRDGGGPSVACFRGALRESHHRHTEQGPHPACDTRIVARTRWRHPYALPCAGMAPTRSTVAHARTLSALDCFTLVHRRSHSCGQCLHRFLFLCQHGERRFRCLSCVVQHMENVYLSRSPYFSLCATAGLAGPGTSRVSYALPVSMATSISS